MLHSMNATSRNNTPQRVCCGQRESNLRELKCFISLKKSVYITNDRKFVFARCHILMTLCQIERSQIQSGWLTRIFRRHVHYFSEFDFHWTQYSSTLVSDYLNQVSFIPNVVYRVRRRYCGLHSNNIFHKTEQLAPCLTFEFIVVFCLDWLPTKAEEPSLFYYLSLMWELGLRL